MSARIFAAMKLSDKIRRAGFALCCMGILMPVGVMYELKRSIVDHVPTSPGWPWSWLILVIPVLLGAGLFQHAAKLAKAGK